MENIKKNPLSLQLNAEDFLPASNEEKQSLVVMRESVNFWKDGIRRLKKNKIAMVSFVFIIAIAIFAYLLPAVWPYSYSEQMKGSNNLKPFEYSASEQARIDAGEKVFPHILGTDRMGRDFAVRIMMGTRVSLSVGLIASVLVLIIGATYGAVVGLCRRLGGQYHDAYYRYSVHHPGHSVDHPAGHGPEGPAGQVCPPSPASSGCRPLAPT